MKEKKNVRRRKLPKTDRNFKLMLRATFLLYQIEGFCGTSSCKEKFFWKIKLIPSRYFGTGLEYFKLCNVSITELIFYKGVFMIHISKSLTSILGTMFLVMFGSTLAVAGSTINVTIKDNGYHVLGSSSGTRAPGFSMAAGEENVIILKNENHTNHSFVSKAFKAMDVVVTGEAEGVKDGDATGWIVEPGKSIQLKFIPPVGKDFSGSWDVFYCTIHGKDKMMGEIVVADTRGGAGAF
ncbi:hypothetical protein [Nitrospira sp. Ecomares 2.1]